MTDRIGAGWQAAKEGQAQEPRGSAPQAGLDIGAGPAQGDRAAEEGHPPFWRTKTLAEMTVTEWESLCDGCARCCLVKLEDRDTGEFHFTDVACTLLDGEACRCRHYAERDTRMPDCVRLTPELVPALGWLPTTCAYRLLAEGQDLPSWHPLMTGAAGSVHEAGISVRHRVSGHEHDLTLDEIIERVVDWPNETPTARG